MGKPAAGDRHYSQALTDFSVGWIQEESEFVSLKAFPVVSVARRADVYYEYDRGDQFRNEAKKRAPGTESAGGGYDLTTTAYKCVKWAYHEDVPWDEMEDADEAVAAVEDSVHSCTNKIRLALEVDFNTNFMTTSVWGTDITGVVSTSPAANQITQWDISGSAPLTDFPQLQDRVAASTGKVPNTLICGKMVFDVLRTHSTIVALYQYVQPGILTEDLVAKALGLERILVSRAVVNSAKEGVSASVDYIFGRNALLCYTPPRASKRTPSAGYSFIWEKFGSGIAMSQFGIDERESDRIEGQSYIVQKKVSSLLGIFITTAISTGWLS